MAQRTVRVVVTTYHHPDGSWRLAQRGDVIDVHDDHLEFFDAAQAEIILPSERVEETSAEDGIEDLSGPDLGEGDEDQAAGDDNEQEPADDGSPPRGGPGSGRAEWAAYADEIGVAYTDDATRDDIIALVDAARD